MRPLIPSDILALGHARAAARRNRDFREADRLRAEIEAAGYRVVDRGTDFALHPAHPADIVEPDGRTRVGWSGAVPSALEEPATHSATLVVVADGGSEPLRRTLEGLRAHAPSGTQVVCVAPPDPDLEAALTPEDLLAPVAGAAPEVVWTAVPLRPVAARNAGARRARGGIVAWLQPGATVTGDVVSPLVDALGDPSVGVAGAVGLHGRDIRHLDAGPAGDAVAIDRTLLAFRRADLLAIGPIDERFFGDEQADVWWSLVLRDGPPEPDSIEGDQPAGDMAAGDEAAGNEAAGNEAAGNEAAGNEAAGNEAASEAAADAAANDEPSGEATPLDEEAEDEAGDGPAWAPRRALALDLPIDPTTAISLAAEPAEPAEAARRRKRDLYRLIDGFTGRPDLLDPAIPTR